MLDCGGAINPGGGAVGGELDYGIGNVHAGVPFARRGVHLPADSEYIGVSTEPGCDLLQLFVRLQVVAQFQPADGSPQMVQVLNREVEEFGHGVFYQIATAVPTSP